jgi:EAL domain-containing protein (putative c-di-GMP-specific phosphodiesterase class I)/ActR/RegA family two-component response regulator
MTPEMPIMTAPQAYQAMLESETRRLLVIDDDRTQRILIGAIARREGFEVDSVGTIQEAFGALDAAAYDTVAVDLSLGESDGVEIIRHIAESGRRPAVLVISGFDERIRDAAIRFGDSLGLSMVGDLRKPIDPMRLKTCLARRATGEAPSAKPAASGPSITAAMVAAALENGDIAPVFQPKVELATGRIVGVEALARWTSATFGNVPPSVFVPLAEEFGLAGPLTLAILRQSLAAAAGWNARFGEIGVAVNVPATCLTDSAFPEVVEAELARAGCPASTLTLEVTESTAMSDLAVTSGVLTRLRIKGVQLSLDDFGTGYSSLSSLLRMPFGELKIDRSFIQACDRDSYAWKIVRATLSLAREFGMKTVAEGIETQAVATMLHQARCDLGQGYFFARPLPGAALETRLELQNEGAAPEKTTMGASTHGHPALSTANP